MAHANNLSTQDVSQGIPEFEASPCLLSSEIKDVPITTPAAIPSVKCH